MINGDTLKVYYLSNIETPHIPFYIGISKNVENRFKQHRQKWKKHKPYITNKNQIILTVLCDTGSNEYSKTLAEKIETSLIKYYNTVNLGSNKVYDVKQYFEKEVKQYKPNRTKKNNQLKDHKKFKTIIKLIHDDPCRYSMQELINMSDFKNIESLNRYTKKYYNTKFSVWLYEYKQLWYSYIINHYKRYKQQVLNP